MMRASLNFLVDNLSPLASQVRSRAGNALEEGRIVVEREVVPVVRRTYMEWQDERLKEWKAYEEKGHTALEVAVTLVVLFVVVFHIELLQLYRHFFAKGGLVEQWKFRYALWQQERRCRQRRLQRLRHQKKQRQSPSKTSLEGASYSDSVGGAAAAKKNMASPTSTASTVEAKSSTSPLPPPPSSRGRVMRLIERSHPSLSPRQSHSPVRNRNNLRATAEANQAGGVPNFPQLHGNSDHKDNSNGSSQGILGNSLNDSDSSDMAVNPDSHSRNGRQPQHSCSTLNSSKSAASSTSLRDPLQIQLSVPMTQSSDDSMEGFRTPRTANSPVPFASSLNNSSSTKSSAVDVSNRVKRRFSTQNNNARSSAAFASDINDIGGGGPPTNTPTRPRGYKNSAAAGNGSMAQTRKRLSGGHLPTNNNGSNSNLNNSTPGNNMDLSPPPFRRNLTAGSAVSSGGRSPVRHARSRTMDMSPTRSQGRLRSSPGAHTYTPNRPMHPRSRSGNAALAGPASASQMYMARQVSAHNNLGQKQPRTPSASSASSHSHHYVPHPPSHRHSSHGTPNQKTPPKSSRRPRGHSPIPSQFSGSHRSSSTRGSGPHHHRTLSPHDLGYE